MNVNTAQPHVTTAASSQFVLYRGLYHCNYCQKDITGVVRIKCAICQDFDLCLDCFSVGVEIDPHKNHHAYRVMDSLAFPLFHPDWGVRKLAWHEGTSAKLCELLACDRCLTCVKVDFETSKQHQYAHSGAYDGIWCLSLIAL